jgi:FAD:protein FMN transferase
VSNVRLRSLLTLLLLVAAGCNGNKPAPEEAALRRFAYPRLIMGVKATLTMYAKSEAEAEHAALAAFTRLDEIEDIASDWRPHSELSKLGAKSGGPPVPVSPELYLLLEKALEVAERSNGAFDPTVGPLVLLWRKSRQTGQLPDPAKLADARTKVGWRKVHLDPINRTAQLEVKGMKLDFGGLAKGYGGDAALAVLRDHGINRAMYEAGGDMVMSKPPPGAKGWPVEITDDVGGHPTIVRLANAACSTSGDTYQFVEIDGVRYSHIVDPATGIGLTHRNLATVIARRGIIADPLSKVASVLPPDEAKKVIAAYPGTRVYIRPGK